MNPHATASVRRPPLVATLGVLFAICHPSLAQQQVRVEFDKKTDLSGYRTFGWTDSDEDLRDTDEQLHHLLIDMITERFTASGLRLADSDPDLQFVYVAAEKRELRRYRYNVGSMALGSHRTIEDERLASVGTLILEIVDASTISTETSNVAV